MHVKLSFILNSLESGGRPKGGATINGNGIPSLGAEHLDNNGGFNFKSIKYIPKEYFETLKKGIIEKENILIVKDGATTGKVSFVSDDFPFEKSSVNEHVFLLKIDQSKAIPKYAFHYLKSPLGQRDILKDFRGATVGGISRGFVDLVKFALPPHIEQLQIANQLSNADDLISQRKQSIALLDDFLKSTFLEMFGDPATNLKGWEAIKLGEMIEYIGDIGSNGSNETVAQNLVMSDTEGYAIMIRTVNLNKKDFIKNIKYVSKRTYDFFKKSQIFGGEIIMNKIGSAGEFWIMPKLNRPVSLGLNQLVIRLKNLNTFYLYYYLSTSYGKKNIKSRINGATTKSITKTAVKDLPLLYPPIELQIKFSQIVEKAESLKSQYQSSLQELENLYGSLSQRAFRGELSNINSSFFD